MTTALLTERTLLEVAEHEGLVLEAYRCSAGVLTWGFGVTNASGHHVDRYIGQPSTVERAVEVYEWLLRTKYLPEVLKAFGRRELSEAQIAAALSFHWNTGAIGRADWVRHWIGGDRAAARASFMNYSRPREIIPRRQAERNLFFDGKWTFDGLVTIYERVNRREPRNPVWSSARQIDIRPHVRAALARNAPGRS